MNINLYLTEMDVEELRRLVRIATLGVTLGVVILALSAVLALLALVV